MTRSLITALGAALCLACGQSASREEQAQPAEQPPAVALPADVQQAVTVADAIAAAPASADSILAAHGMSPEVFDSLMYAIAADPAKSAAYTAARQR